MRSTISKNTFELLKSQLTLFVRSIEQAIEQARGPNITVIIPEEISNCISQLNYIAETVQNYIRYDTACSREQYDTFIEQIKRAKPKDGNIQREKKEGLLIFRNVTVSTYSVSMFSGYDIFVDSLSKLPDNQEDDLKTSTPQTDLATMVKEEISQSLAPIQAQLDTVIKEKEALQQQVQVYKTREQQLCQIFNFDLGNRTQEEMVTFFSQFAPQIEALTKSNVVPRQNSDSDNIRDINMAHADLEEIYQYEMPPPKKKRDAWLKEADENQVFYDQYKLDQCVSLAMYVAIMDLRTYYKSLVSNNNSNNNHLTYFGNRSDLEKQTVSDIIYELLDQSLCESCDYSQVSWTKKIETLKNQFNNRLSEALQAVLNAIAENKYSDDLPPTSKQDKATYLNKLASSESTLLPNNKSKQKVYCDIAQAKTISTFSPQLD